MGIEILPRSWEVLPRAEVNAYLKEASNLSDSSLFCPCYCIWMCRRYFMCPHSTYDSKFPSMANFCMRSFLPPFQGVFSDHWDNCSNRSITTELGIKKLIYQYWVGLTLTALYYSYLHTHIIFLHVLINYFPEGRIQVQQSIIYIGLHNTLLTLEKY